jgi:phytoene synthase
MRNAAIEQAGRRQAGAVLAAGSKSFALAGRLLPAVCRQDAAVVYAFCRRADDLVDLAGPGEAAPWVRRLRRELASIYRGEPQGDPVLAAFQEVVQRRRIPRAYPGELIEGFAMDLPAPLVYRSWDELRLYCYRVAGTVGLMMCHVMGVTDDGRLRHAAALGMAMQLTNIARDVAEDWARGRLYLPRPLLGEDLVPGGPLTPHARAVLSAALPALLAAARPLYRTGDEGLTALSGRCAVAVRAARLVYSAIGDRIAARGHDVGAPRAIVSRGRKLWLLARAAAEVLLRRPFRKNRGAPRPPRSLLRSPDDLAIALP